MPLFELVIALLRAGAILSAWARHISVPYPTLLALAGAGLALMPHMSSVMLDPELAREMKHYRVLESGEGG